jgi:hypothetical protein
MSTLPTTTACYRERILELQAQIQRLLASTHRRRCSPHELARLDRRMQPLYAAISAMYAETDI